MQRPGGRTILTGLASSAGLVPWLMADGMIWVRDGRWPPGFPVLTLVPTPFVGHPLGHRLAPS
jgi:hypothetical protein